MNTDRYIAREAERGVLSLLLREFDKAKKLLGQIAPGQFGDPLHKRIAHEIWKKAAADGAVDLVIMDSVLPDCLDYMIDLAGSYSSLAGSDIYIRDIVDAQRRRALRRLGENLTDKSASLDVQEIIDNARVELSRISQKQYDEEYALGDVILSVHERIFGAEQAEYSGIGIPALDRLILGFQPSALYVVGARPAVGKSVFGMIAALKAAQAGKPALIINREMEKENLVTRMLSHISGVDVGAIRRKTMDPGEQGSFLTAYGELDNLPLAIANKPSTPGQVREAALRVYEEKGLGLLVVDYLQRLTSGRRTQNRTEEVGIISRAMKDLAMELKIPVVLLAQLNRTAANSRPNMSQLRESGDIEADADSVILLHRPDAQDVPASKQVLYDACRRRNSTYLEMILDKNREGETALIPVMFDGRHMRYVPLQKEET